jgi:hypothetical protein
MNYRSRILNDQKMTSTQKTGGDFPQKGVKLPNKSKHVIGNAFLLKLLPFWIVFSILTLPGYAQTYKLRAFTTLSHEDWRDSAYRFPTFQRGSMILNTGYLTEVPTPVNYNIFRERMEVIGSRGDTVPMFSSPDITLINIAGHLFMNHYPKGFIEILKEGRISLGVQTTFKVLMEASSGERFVGVIDLRETTCYYDRWYRKSDWYYLIDDKSNLRNVTRALLTQLFPDQKEKIKKYIKYYNVNFKTRHSVPELVIYCIENAAVVSSSK